MFARKFLLAFCAICIFYSVGMTAIYFAESAKVKTCWERLTIERRIRAEDAVVEKTEADQTEYLHDKVVQSYLNLLESVSSDEPPQRVKFYQGVLAFNLLALRRPWRCNPPESVLGHVPGLDGQVLDGGKRIYLETFVNDNREMFLLAVAR